MIRLCEIRVCGEVSVIRVCGLRVCVIRVYEIKVCGEVCDESVWDKSV